MVYVKALHISALVVWAAGLLYLPSLLIAHRGVDSRPEFIRLRNATRFNYNALVSPAAFLAVGSGTALLFLGTDVLQGWMFLKLAAVGVLVMAHVHYGFVLGRLAEGGREPPRIRLLAVLAIVLGSAAVILWLVLAKPDIPTGMLPAWLHEPGGLQSVLSIVTPI